MRNHIWIQTKPFHFFPRTLVIFLIRGIREQKFRLAFGGISFHGHDNCRPNEDSVIARLGGDEGTFLDAVAFPQFGGDDDRAALAHFYRVHRCQFIRISEFRANRFPRYLAPVGIYKWPEKLGGILRPHAMKAAHNVRPCGPRMTQGPGGLLAKHPRTA